MNEVREGESPLATELFIQFSDNQEKARAASEERSSKREKRWFIMTLCSLGAVITMALGTFGLISSMEVETTTETTTTYEANGLNAIINSGDGNVTLGSDQQEDFANMIERWGADNDVDIDKDALWDWITSAAE